MHGRKPLMVPGISPFLFSCDSVRQDYLTTELTHRATP